MVGDPPLLGAAAFLGARRLAVARFRFAFAVPFALAVLFRFAFAFFFMSGSLLPTSRVLKRHRGIPSQPQLDPGRAGMW
jgi:hypothetical protein